MLVRVAWWSSNIFMTKLFCKTNLRVRQSCFQKTLWGSLAHKNVRFKTKFGFIACKWGRCFKNYQNTGQCGAYIFGSLRDSKIWIFCHNSLSRILTDFMHDWFCAWLISHIPFTKGLKVRRERLLWQKRPSFRDRALDLMNIKFAPSKFAPYELKLHVFFTYHFCEQSIFLKRV
jgi:hypothetical protein